MLFRSDGIENALGTFGFDSCNDGFFDTFCGLLPSIFSASAAEMGSMEMVKEAMGEMMEKKEELGARERKLQVAALKERTQKNERKLQDTFFTTMFCEGEGCTGMVGAALQGCFIFVGFPYPLSHIHLTQCIIYDFSVAVILTLA